MNLNMQTMKLEGECLCSVHSVNSLACLLHGCLSEYHSSSTVAIYLAAWMMSVDENLNVCM